MNDALRGLSGAENYVRQPSGLELVEELMLCDIHICNLEFEGGGG
jgi:hypothetical protein